jgi:LmbE family N-acetylglucosaminyl deacetylase
MTSKRYHRLKKKRALLRTLVAVIGSLFFLLTASYGLFFSFILLLFICNELFLADHLFYDPKNDYQYEFAKGERTTSVWVGEGLELDLQNIEEEFDTALLEIRVKSTFLGSILDPFVSIRAGEFERQQYFERTVDGVRYINISEFLRVRERIKIEPCRCQLFRDNSKVILFSNPRLEGKSLLVIAPHADDAEIAAFGLYSSNNSAIVTITAGEVGSKGFENFYPEAKQAALFKGRLRAWDSVAVPLWGGVQQEQVIQLGYFCLCLKAMHDSPDEAIKSQAAGIDDTRLFRAFNQFQFGSDNNGKPSWSNLIDDLAECIERVKPDVIITAHPQLDPHSDHYYSTVAVSQALKKTHHLPAEIYLYANHLTYSDQFPFGPVHTLASLPPNMENNLKVDSVVSIPLSMDKQKDKAAALGMMHDLQSPLRWKKQLRFKLQSILIGRKQPPYGDDEYFRKAVRANELFYRVQEGGLDEVCDDTDKKN